MWNVVIPSCQKHKQYKTNRIQRKNPVGMKKSSFQQIKGDTSNVYKSKGRDSWNSKTD